MYFRFACGERINYLMSFDDFDLALVRSVIGGLRSTFHTGEVSTDARMERHHKVSLMPKAERDTYLKMTGRFLSMNRASLGLRLEQDSKRGSGRRWQKVA